MNMGTPEEGVRVVSHYKSYNYGNLAMGEEHNTATGDFDHNWSMGCSQTARFLQKIEVA